jgi:rare lipoprotein A (peptidoglycan hydrolase)
MRRTTFTKAVALTLVAASGAAITPASALAGTGGVSSPPSGSMVAPAAVRKAALATWFGPGFYGRTTACGQILTPAVVGVANRTLPCGTLVKVSYRGRRLILPVIDRGPYGNNGAAWDLTTEAARALGVVDSARIGARIIGSVANTPLLGLPAAPTPGLAPGSTLVTPVPAAVAATGGVPVR